MANNSATRLNGAASIIREEDLQDLEEFQRDLEAKIDQAHGDGRAFMMAQYVRLLAIVKSEVKRVRDRFDRENLAYRRQAQKELKAKQKAAQQQQRDEA